MASNRNPPSPSTTEALERLGRLSLRDLSMEGLLQTVADLTGTVVRGRTETSVTLLVEGRPSTVASTGRLAPSWTRRSTTAATAPACTAPAPAS
ncbi:hypothetical protein [Geodermatophilus sp. URMC 63]